MANESLIFRKGLQAKLATLPIKPGAISITIDEPGMYIDLPANEALGHSNDYRVRIGDVITVQTLGELANLKLDALTPDNLSDDGGKTSLAGRINEYSTSALYYVTGQNMLLKYNAATGKFIWINDTTSLQEQISALGATVADHETRLGNVEKAIGDADDTETEATVYGAIAKVRADLGDQIAGILGGGDGVTLDSLDAAIKAEAKTRKETDDALDGKITALSASVYTKDQTYTKEEVEAEIKAVTDVTDTYQTAWEKFATDAVAVEAEAREAAINGENGVVAKITALNNTVTADYETKNDAAAKLAEAKEEAASKASAAESAAKTHAETYTNTREAEIRKDFAAADTELDSKITTLNNNLANYATTESLNTAVGTLTSNIATAKGEAIADAKANAEAYTDAQLKAFKEGDYATYKTTTNEAIAELNNNKANASEVYTKGDIDTKVNDITAAIGKQKTDLEAYANQAEADANTYTDTKVGEVATALAGHVSTATTTYETKDDATAKLNAAKAYADGTQTAAEANAKDYTDAREDKIREDFAKADETLSLAITTLNTVTIPTLALKDETYTRTEVDNKDAATLQSAKDYVASLLRAAEAMRYMGTLTSADPADEVIKKTGVEAGDVWVVSQLSTDGTYKPGDMFIAKEDGATTIAQWNHVKTGYDANLEQKLSTTVNDDANGGKVTLDSIGTLDTGSIEIKADLNSAIRVTMTKDDSGNHGTATIGMVWEDFQ